MIFFGISDYPCALAPVLSKPRLLEHGHCDRRGSESDWRVGGVCSAPTLDKGAVLGLGGEQWAGMRFRHMTQDSERFKTHTTFISGLLYLIFLDRGWLRATATTDTPNQGRGGAAALPIQRDTVRPWKLANHCRTPHSAWLAATTLNERNQMWNSVRYVWPLIRSSTPGQTNLWQRSWPPSPFRWLAACRSFQGRPCLCPCFGGSLSGSVWDNLICTFKLCVFPVCTLYFKKTRQYQISTCLTAILFFSQFDEQCELKAIEKEKTVVALPPKEASKCQREDLAEAFHVRIEFAFDGGCEEVFRWRRKKSQSPEHYFRILCYNTFSLSFKQYIILWKLNHSDFPCGILPTLVSTALTLTRPLPENRQPPNTGLCVSLDQRHSIEKP